MYIVYPTRICQSKSNIHPNLISEKEIKEKFQKKDEYYMIELMHALKI